MRILGIDPGYAIVGAGVVDYNGNKFKLVEYAAITTPSNIPFIDRLEEVYDGVCYLLEKFRPDAMAVEKLYFTNNQKTAIDVSQSRGVILLAAKKYFCPVYEYTPLQVKQGVVGYGKAQKRQVMEMTRQILSLKEVPKPDDSADALAIAICHGHTSSSLLFKAKQYENM